MMAPLSSAAIHLREAARAFEQAKCPELAFEADALARTAGLIDATRDAAEAARLAQSEAESQAWETTDGRAFDQAVRGMPTEELEQRMGLAR